MEQRNAVIETLKAMAELSGRNISPAAATILAGDLSAYSDSQVLDALRKCRREVPRFPTIAEIISRIEDGHPGVEEAWAICPKAESDSTVWTEEISKAFFAALPLIDEDPIAARQAFKEVYTKELQNARDERRAPKWIASLGHDVRGREAAVIEAVCKKRIAIEDARKIVPELPAPNAEFRKLLGDALKQIPAPTGEQ